MGNPHVDGVKHLWAAARLIVSITTVVADRLSNNLGRVINIVNSQKSTGASGLTTAILLVIASIGAMAIYAGINAGLLYGGEGKTKVQSTYAESGQKLDLRGSVVAKTLPSGVVDEISFHLSTRTAEPIDMNPEFTISRYLDSEQEQVIPASKVTLIPLGNANSDFVIEAGELHELKITDLAKTLNPGLRGSTSMLLEITSFQGDLLRIKRTTPVVLETYTDLG